MPSCSSNWRRNMFLPLFASFFLAVVWSGTASAQLLRTITVDAIAADEADQGCTLTEAISLANTGSMDSFGCDVVETETGVVPAYVINIPAIRYLIDRPFVLRGVITLQGQGMDLTIIDAAGSDRVFQVNSSALANFRDLGITGGLIEGRFGVGAGIMLEAGSLRLERVHVFGNRALGSLGLFTVDGGGIHTNGGSLEVLESIVSNNAATNAGGGIFFGSGPFPSAPFLRIVNSVIEGNEAFRGGGLYGQSSAIVGIGNVFRENTAIDQGGGMYLLSLDRQPRPTAVIVASSVSGNSAGTEGGGIYNNGKLDIANSTLAFNSANRNGGAMWVSATVNASHLSIVANQAVDSGGAFEGNGVLNLYGSVASQNAVLLGSGGDCPEVTTISQGFNALSDNASCESLFPSGLPNASGDFAGPGAGVEEIAFEPSSLDLPIFEPGPGSILVDQIPATNCRFLADGANTEFGPGDPVLTDQRGVLRDPFCDIGAVERAILFADSFE